MPKILAIDAGNTRVKWGLFNADNTMLESGACLKTDIAKIQLPAATRIVASNVAGERIQHQLESMFSQQASVHWISAKANACGVSNAYSPPEKLGTDRWAALIAAWHITRAPCVVVNAGTALTIDALSVNAGHGAFIGGMIMPGMHLMQQSLGLSTAQLPVPQLTVPQAESPLIFATNTADAMRAGALNAACGAILQMVAALKTQCQQAPLIIISGGDAAMIQQQFSADVTNTVLIVDNLVLQGLLFIHHADAEKT